ncbi:hypothetical protein [Cereibacter azotoformans]|uniref:Uncharacterized protein n=1 Tax=Cereibacter azotoformans TaxID=43057 RepID=A0A2T5JTA0_9RHOB|nr:hypothetical protein [Cereibacter azotoformans]PTR13394.1 hypothetical protein C8J28_12224 [Cereibacter azotoformans]
MPLAPERQKEQWKVYTRDRRRALREVELMQLSVWVPREARDAVLALLQPHTDRARLISLLAGITPYDRALALGLLQAIGGPLTIEEVEAIVEFRRAGRRAEEAQAAVIRHRLPPALAEPPR